MLRAISFDLDDTLWPVGPVLRHAEQRLHAHLRHHHPRLAQRFDFQGMLALRERLLSESPDLAKNVTHLRKAVLARAARESGEDEAAMETAFEVFMEARNQVEFYPEVLHVLARLQPHYRLGALSNGNADVARTGLSAYFSFAVSAASVGEAKPHPETFTAAVNAARVQRHELLHVGDDPETDVSGAVLAGVKCVWISRDGNPWPEARFPGLRPDAQVASLTDLPGLLRVWEEHA